MLTHVSRRSLSSRSSSESSGSSSGLSFGLGSSFFVVAVREAAFSVDFGAIVFERRERYGDNKEC